MSTMNKSPRNELTIKQKVQLIQAWEHQKTTSRQLATQFRIGKTQALSILKNKDKILELYMNKDNRNRIRFNYDVTYEMVDQMTWNWYAANKTSENTISGPKLQEKALEFAKQLNQPNFKASNGWLYSFKKRHNILSPKVGPEDGMPDLAGPDFGDMPSEGCFDDFSGGASAYPHGGFVGESWEDKMKALLSGYDRKDVYLTGCTGLWYNTLPNARGESSTNTEDKERVTVLLGCNACGHFLKPLVIGRDENPWSSEQLSQHELPVNWQHNIKAVLHTGSLTNWLEDLNERTRLERRSILVILDTASSWLLPISATWPFVKVTQLLSNPLDQEFFHTFKLHYRIQHLLHILAMAKTVPSILPGDAIQSVNLTDVCQRIFASIIKVPPAEISRCFFHSGFPADYYRLEDHVQQQSQELLDASFAQLDTLVHDTAALFQFQVSLTADAYLRADQGLPVTWDVMPDNTAKSEMRNDCVMDRQEPSDTRAFCTPSASNNADHAPAKQDLESENHSDSPDSPLTDYSHFAINSYEQASYWAHQLQKFALEKNDPELISLFTQSHQVLMQRLAEKGARSCRYDTEAGTDIKLEAPDSMDSS